MSGKRASRSVRRSEKRRRIQPPLRNGINAAPLRLPDGQWSTLGEWFEYRFGCEGLELLSRSDVYAGHNVALKADDAYHAGERVWVFRPVLDEPAQPLELPVVAENERFVVVDKPHGMASVPKGSHVAQSALVTARRQFHNDLLVAAHRLDLETAGLLLFVKSPQWRGAYQMLFERRRISKVYRAIAPIVPSAQGKIAAHAGTTWHSELTLHKTDGQLQVHVIAADSRRRHAEVCTAITGHVPAGKGSGSITDQGGDIGQSGYANHGVCSTGDEHNHGYVGSYYGERRRPITRTQMNAVTDITLTRELGYGLGLYTLYPHTGFTHQLRVAMNELGAPICGDPIYPRVLTPAQSAARPYPLQLLAAQLDFDDPVTGEHVCCESARELALEE